MNAIITGSSKGIGKAIAIQLAKENYNLALCARNKEALMQTASEIKLINPGIKIYTEACDLSNKEACIRFANNCVQQFETIDVLINNAGFYLPGEIATEADDILEQMIQTNVYSAYHVSRSIIPNMKSNKKGCIINIGSVAGLQAYQNGGSYSISKFALIGFSKNLREELKSHQIKVSCINPGATMSDSWSGSDIAEERIMEANDIAIMVSATCKLSPQAVLEDVTLRPILGDL